jgi:hypothetical protein
MWHVGLHILSAPSGRLLFAALLLHSMVMSVYAQDATQTVRRSEPPTTSTTGPDQRSTYQGLYGRQRSGDERGQLLDLDLKLYGTYSENLTGRDLYQNAANPLASSKSTLYPGSSGRLDYTWKNDNLTLDALSLTSVNFYPEFDNRTSVGELASGGFSWRLSPSLTFSSSESYTYRPAFALIPTDTFSSADGAEGAVSATELAFNNVAGYTVGSIVNLTKNLSARTSISAHYGYRSSQFSGNTFNLRTHDVGATFRRGMSQYASIYAGYSFRRGGTGGQSRIHDIEAGLDYDRPLSFSRRTYVSLSTGSSFVQAVSANPVGLPGRFRFLGSAGLRREIGQSWSARFQYRRNLSFLEGFAQPVFTTSYMGNFGGYINRRTNVSLSFIHSIVDRAQAGTRAFGTTNASANMRFAFQRHIAAYTDLAFSGFQSADASVSTVIPSRNVNRAQIRAGITFWIPLVGR